MNELSLLSRESSFFAASRCVVQSGKSAHHLPRVQITRLVTMVTRRAAVAGSYCLAKVGGVGWVGWLHEKFVQNKNQKKSGHLTGQDRTGQERSGARPKVRFEASSKSFKKSHFPGF